MVFGISCLQVSITTATTTADIYVTSSGRGLVGYQLRSTNTCCIAKTPHQLFGITLEGYFSMVNGQWQRTTDMVATAQPSTELDGLPSNHI